MALTRPSLRLRLTLGTAAATLVAMAILVAATQVLQRESAQAEARSVLASRVDAAAATVDVSDGTVSALETPADTLDEAIWIYDRSGGLLDGQPPSSALAGPVAAARQTTVPLQRTVNGHELLRALPVISRGQHVATVVAVADLHPYESGASRALWLSVLLGGAAVLAAAGASWAAATRALHRVHDMADQADDWREHDLDRRFPEGGGDELGDLGSTLNRMLDRIAAAIHSERRLTDGVAHELRTPLSVIRAEAQLALASPSDTEQSLAGIVRATERMDTSIEALLAAARGHHDPTDVCRVADVLAQAAHVVRPSGDVSVAVVHAGEGLLAAAPADLVVAMLKPLVDNAVHHARHRVELRAEARSATVLLHVDDDGPGIPEDQRQRAFSAGVSSRDGGTGLGLPLALRLAQSTGGSIIVPPGPRSRVTVILPRP